MSHRIFALLLIRNNEISYASSSPDSLTDLRRIYEEWDWPFCNCLEACCCAVPLLPGSILPFIESEQEIPKHGVTRMRVLSFMMLPYASVDFKKGLKDSVLQFVEGGFVGLYEVIRSLHDIREHSRAHRPIHLLLQDEELSKQLGFRRSEIPYRISGFLCGSAICEWSSFWRRMRKCSGSDESRMRRFEEEMDDCLSNINDELATLHDICRWVQARVNKKAYPYSTEILRASVFWGAQRVLIKSYDWRLIKSLGWKRAGLHYRSGSLPWQTGWMATDAETVSLIGQLATASDYF